MSTRYLYGQGQAHVVGKTWFLSNLAFDDIDDTFIILEGEKHDILDLWEKQNLTLQQGLVLIFKLKALAFFASMILFS